MTRSRWLSVATWLAVLLFLEWGYEATVAKWINAGWEALR